MHVIVLCKKKYIVVHISTFKQSVFRINFGEKIISYDYEKGILGYKLA